MNEFAANRALRVVVLRGAGTLPFCSGVEDLPEFETVRANAEGARAYEEANVVAFDAIASCPLPTIAMIRSFCMGGGMGLAAACDLRVASESAEVRIRWAASASLIRLPRSATSSPPSARPMPRICFTPRGA